MSAACPCCGQRCSAPRTSCARRSPSVTLITPRRPPRTDHGGPARRPNQGAPPARGGPPLLQQAVRQGGRTRRIHLLSPKSSEGNRLQVRDDRAVGDRLVVGQRSRIL